MNQLFSWLQKPYPLTDTKGSQFKMASLLSLVVALFLFVLQPFNQHETKTQALTTALVGGATVFVTIYFHFLVLFPLFPKFFREERWTIGRELIWTLVVIISIAITNMALIAIWGGFPVTWRNLWIVIVDTTIIGIAPATASILINQARLLRRYRRQALALNEVVQRVGAATGEQTIVKENEAINRPETGVAASLPESGQIIDRATDQLTEGTLPPALPGAKTRASDLSAHTAKIDVSKVQSATTQADSSSPIILSAETGKEQVAVAPADLLAISSADNYCKIYLRENGRVRSVILRSPLKRLEGMLATYPYFWRCHRTAIVNLEAITGVGGTAQGYRLEIAGMEETIPVSRSLNAQLREKLGAGIAQ